MIYKMIQKQNRDENLKQDKDKMKVLYMKSVAC